MKNRLYLLLCSALYSWQPIQAAASSDSPFVYDDAEKTVNVISIPGFLKEVGICPEQITISSYSYTRRDDLSAEKAISKLSHIQRECLPLVTDLFTALPTEENPLENILHRLIVSKIAIGDLFFTMSGPSTITSSASDHLRSLREIIASIDEDTVRSTYWNLLDVQPNTIKQTLLTPTHETNPPKPRSTLSTILAWLNIFKAEQANGNISRAPEALAEEIEAQFNAQRKQIQRNRETVLAHVAPGLAALRTLKQIAEQGKLSPAELNEESSRSTCSHQ